MINATIYRAKGRQFNQEELEVRLQSQSRKIRRRDARKAAKKK
jgi:hypothetical protein